MDWNSVAVVASLLSVAIALLSLWIETRQSTRLHQFDLIVALEERYVSPEMLALRAEAAALLLDERAAALPPRRLDQLLGFFEFLGLLRRQRALPSYVIWQSFGTPVALYFAAAQSHVRALNMRNRSVYSEFIALERALRAVERRKAGADSPDLSPSPQQVQAFLRAEADIASDHAK